jgi:LmbE family N-acetylglucosaminyl deacetylase
VISRDIARPHRALAIAAHPDDIEFGCGATLAKWSAAGCEVSHLVCTDGSKGTWDAQADIAALVEVRKHEQRAAARALGATGKVVFLGRVDGELTNDRATQSEVARWIRVLRPGVVLGHDPWKRYRLHPDHRAAGFLTVDAIVAARDPHFFPEHGVPHHRPDALLLFEADEPDHVEDVTGRGDAKVAALLAHESQFETTMKIGQDQSERAAIERDAFARRIEDELADAGGWAGLPDGHTGERFKLMADL